MNFDRNNGSNSMRIDEIGLANLDHDLLSETNAFKPAIKAYKLR